MDPPLPHARAASVPSPHRPFTYSTRSTGVHTGLHTGVHTSATRPSHIVAQETIVAKRVLEIAFDEIKQKLRTLPTSVRTLATSVHTLPTSGTESLHFACSVDAVYNAMKEGLLLANEIALSEIATTTQVDDRSPANSPTNTDGDGHDGDGHGHETRPSVVPRELQTMHRASSLEIGPEDAEDDPEALYHGNTSDCDSECDSSCPLSSPLAQAPPSTPPPPRLFRAQSSCDDPLLSHTNFSTFTTTLSDSNPPTPTLTSLPAPPPPPPASPPPESPEHTTNKRSSLRVTVDSAIKMEEGMFRDYILYTIASEVITDDPTDYDSLPIVQKFTVGRRYRDFLQLHTALLHHITTGAQTAAHNQASIAILTLGGPVLPALPPKTTTIPGLTRNTLDSHAESRRKALQRWLQHLVTHPSLRAAPPLQTFLTAATKNVNYATPTSAIDNWVTQVKPVVTATDGARTPRSLSRPASQTTEDYKDRLNSSLGALNKQVKAMMPPLDNALQVAEGLAVAMCGEVGVFGEFARGLQALPQCEGRGSVERVCFATLCSAAAGMAECKGRIHEAMEDDFLEPMRHLIMSVMPAMKGRVKALKDQANVVVKKMEREDKGESYHSADSPVSPHGEEEPGTGLGDKWELKVLSEAVEKASALLIHEWKLVRNIRSTTFSVEAARFARSAASAHWEIAASWETAKNGLEEALSAMPVPPPAAVRKPEPVFTPTPIPAVGIPEYAQLREHMMESAKEEESESDESGEDEGVGGNRSAAGSRTDSSSSVMADAVEEARRMSGDSIKIDLDPLMGMMLDKPVIPGDRRTPPTRRNSAELFGFTEDSDAKRGPPPPSPRGGREKEREKERVKEKEKERNKERRGRSQDVGKEKSKDKGRDRSMPRDRDRDRLQKKESRSTSRGPRGHSVPRGGRSQSRGCDSSEDSHERESEDPFNDIYDGDGAENAAEPEPELSNRAERGGTVRKKKRAVQRGALSAGVSSLKRNAGVKAESVEKTETAGIDKVLEKQKMKAEQEAKNQPTPFVPGLKKEASGNRKKGSSRDDNGSSEPSYFIYSAPTPQSIKQNQSRVPSMPTPTPSPAPKKKKEEPEREREREAEKEKERAQAAAPVTPARPKEPAPAQTPAVGKPMTGGWEEVKMDDGRIYYYHRLTRATRWEKPDAKLEGEMEERIQREEMQKQQAMEERRREREREKEKKDDEERQKSDLNSSTSEEVKEWASGKSVHQMLNELDSIFEGAPVPVGRSLTYESGSGEIKKAYMKAIRAVHPDKIKADASVRTKLLSAAVFGAINGAYEKKKRIEGW